MKMMFWGAESDGKTLTPVVYSPPITVFLFLFFFFCGRIFIFYDKEPPQGKAHQTHPWIVNPGYTTPPARTVYRVIQGSF